MGHHNIFDSRRKAVKQFYTSLFGTTKFSHIHIDECQGQRSGHREGPRLDITNSKLNSVYSKGKIYLVTFEKTTNCKLGQRV
jgi:hypothetical protein